MHTSQLLLGAIGSFAALSACAVTPGPNKHFRIDNIESVLSGDYSIDAQAMLYCEFRHPVSSCDKHATSLSILVVLSSIHILTTGISITVNASDIFDQKVNKAPGPYPSDCLFFYTLNQADKSFGCGGNHYEVNLTDFKSTQDFVLTIVNRYGSVRT